ncbi:MAG: hypothetical protein QW404_02695, partial [Candidatus Nanoarchaeia archaeon]
MSLEGFQYFIYPFMDFFALMSAVFALLVFFKIRKTSLPFFKQNRWLVRVFVLLALAAMSAAIAEFSWDIIEWVYGSEAEFGLPNLFYVIDSCLLVFAFFYFSISIYKLEKKLGLGLFLNLTSSTILVIMVYFFINKYIFSVYAEESFLSLFLGYFYPMMSSLIFFNTLSIFIFLRRFSFFAWPLLFFALAGIFVFVGD